METNRKKRSSIRKAYEDEVTIVRSKRKISFNRRRSVREFTASDNPKEWVDSYDVSDPKNHSEDTAGEKSMQKHNSTKISQHGSEDKENIWTEDISYKTSTTLQPSVLPQHSSYINKKSESGHVLPVENSFDVTLTEKERFMRLTEPFSFSVVDYEAEHLRRSQSLSIEAEQTACFRNELESQSGVIKRLNSINVASKYRFNVPDVECDLLQEQCSSVHRLSNAIPTGMDVVAKSNDESTKFEYAMEISTIDDRKENLSLISTNLKEKTLHFAETIVQEKSALPSTNKTIHFSNDEEDAMNITMTQEDDVLDVSMKETFSSPKRTENCMELTKVAGSDIINDVSMKEAFTSPNQSEECMELTNVADIDKVKNDKVTVKCKPVVEHIIASEIGIKRNQNEEYNNNMEYFDQPPDINKECQKNTILVDESLDIWNSEEFDMNNSSILLKNATMDSDHSLHEFRMQNGGAKLNFLQLNEEFEKGRIKIFSYTTPSKTPITLLNKRADVQRSKLYNESVMESSFQVDGPKEFLMQQKKNESENKFNYQQMTNTICLTPYRRVLQKCTSIDETPHRSIMEFERLEKEANNEISQTPLKSRANTLRAPKPRQTLLFDDLSLDMSGIEVVQNSLESSNTRKPYTVNNSKEPAIDVHVKSNEIECKNIMGTENVKSKKRFTLIDTQDMDNDEIKTNRTIMESQDIDVEEDCSINVAKNNRITSVKTNRRHTILETQDVDGEEDCVKNVRKIQTILKPDGIHANIESSNNIIRNNQAAGNIKKNRRQTILEPDDMDAVDDSSKNVNGNEQAAGNTMKNRRQTILESDDIDVEDKSANNVVVALNIMTNKRQTILEPDDIDVENESSNNEAVVNIKANRQQKILESTDVDSGQISAKNVNKINQGGGSIKKNRRQTILEPDNIDVENESSNDVNKNNQAIRDLKENRRQTILAPDIIYAEDESSNNCNKNEQVAGNFKPIKRQTILEPKNIDAEVEANFANNVNKNDQDARSSTIRRRQTVLEPNDIDAEDESSSNVNINSQGVGSSKCNRRQTILEPNDIDAEVDTDSSNNVNKNNQGERSNKTNRRQTILEPDDINAEVDADSSNNVNKNSQGAGSSKINRRQTILKSNEIDAHSFNNINKNRQDAGSSKGNRRQTILEPDDIDAESDTSNNVSKNNQAVISTKRKSRRTKVDPVVIDADEYCSDNFSKNTPVIRIIKTNTRQTILEPQDIDEEEINQTNIGKSIPASITVKTKRRHTKLEPENMEVLETCSKIGKQINSVSDKCKSSNSLSIIDCQHININSKKDSSKINNKCDEASETYSPFCKIRSLGRDVCTAKTPEEIGTTVPMHVTKSHIPVLISSAKKRNSVLSLSQQQPEDLDFSVCTLPVPRRLLQAAEKSVMEVFPQNNELSQTKKPCEIFEDHPITISDVSDYFLAQRNKLQYAKQDEDVLSSVPTPNMSIRYNELLSENISVLAPNRQCYSVANTTEYKMEQFNDFYMNLSCDSASQIENISPVHSMNNPSVDDHAIMLPKQCEDVDDDVAIVAIAEPARNQHVEKHMDDSVICVPPDTFIQPYQPSPEPDIGIEDLHKWREKSKISDDIAQYRRASLDLPLNLSDRSRRSANNTCVEDEEDDRFSEFKTKYFELIKTIERPLQESEVQHTNNTQLESSINRLCRLLKEQCANWIINKKMRFRRKLLFYHKHLPKECFELLYAEKNGPMGEIEILQLNRLSKNAKKNWLPLDYVLDFQLKLELPHNLMQAYNCHDIRSLCETMCTIDQICLDVKQLGISLYRIVCTQDAQLIRCGLDTYVQKFIRRLILNEDDDYPEVQKVEYRVVVRHLRQLCFSNIVLPRLYAFREDIQMLPSGLDFLEEFLIDPEKHLKQ